MKLQVIVATALLGAAFPSFAQREETFTEIKPGETSVDPGNLIRGAERGDVRAINNLGLLWARGVGVEPNFQEAMRWWKEGARRGYPLSMNNLGLLYANGHGVKQDYGQAMKWWEMSAEAGNAWAMNSIGDLYENGQGVDQSYAEARSWYERAAQAEDGLAMYNLGHFYEDALGVEKNLKRARDWYERSADKGIALSMYKLARMLEEGRGAPADLAEAHAWMTVASKYFTAEDAADAEANSQALSALTRRLDQRQASRSGEIARNLEARIEERRKAKALKPGPGESET